MSVPVINIAAMRDWEKATWATGQTETEVIRRVGQRLASRIRQLTREGDAILILAGKGHNGDDARAALGLLGDRRVKLLEVLQPESDLSTLKAALRESPVLIIDGLFGIGLNRPLAKPWQEFIATVNAAKLPVLAVDVPSGLNADTGELLGAAIQACHTLTVGAPKMGMLAEGAGAYVGRLEVLDSVGLIPCPLGGDLIWTEPADFQHFPPRRAIAAHKGTYGHVAIIAGSPGYHGAAVLATRGAQRAQPGRTTVLPQPGVYEAVASQLQSAMVSPWQPATQLPESVTALLVGPGLAGKMPKSFKRILNAWWRDWEHPLVVDASGMDLLAAGPFAPETCRVLTPHPGEAARLLNWTVAQVQANRLAAVRELSHRHGNAWVILKGHQTLIGRHTGEVFVNSSGNPHLAQGGSGDLLAGFLAGLLAQPPLQAEVARTLRYAVWQHGAAADQLQASRANWIIEDLANEIGDVR